MKKITIREDYVGITGGIKAGIILNQVAFWTQQSYESDQNLQIEIENFQNTLPEEQWADEETLNNLKTFGWIVVELKILNYFTLLNLTAKELNEYLKELEKKELIDLRNNVTEKTWLCRANIRKIKIEMMKQGYRNSIDTQI